MHILRNGSLPSLQGPDNWFTGRVRIDGLYQPDSRPPQEWSSGAG